jgi:hypothetical protein
MTTCFGLSYLIRPSSSLSQDWSHINGLFEYYRVRAMKIKYVPTVTADITYNFTP